MTGNMTDVLWLLVCTALVLVMQVGFTCLEDGSVRVKNSSNVAIKNVVDFLISSAIFWIFGFALMFGSSLSGFVGSDGFFFHENRNPWFGAFFLFQLVFAGTATTIISGAVAERIRFSGYIIITVIIASVIYPLFGHWAWAGVALSGTKGWLASLGFVDFAGATVVHSIGGWVALAAIIIIGPRTGRFGEGGRTPRAQNLPMSAAGVLLLWIGWLGFNGGSTLTLTGAVPGILLNTFLAGSFGGLACLVAGWRIRGYPDVRLILNGVLTGLVGVTASANAVVPLSAVAIGIVSGLLCYGATSLLERLRIDDVVGAVPVHAVGGTWGTLTVALFGDPEILGTGLGRWEQLAVQGLGVFVCFAWSFGLCFVLLRLVNRWFPLRVSLDTEHIGLNLGEHGLASDSVDLLREMQGTENADEGLLRPVSVDPMSDVGEIAAHYNFLLNKVNEARKRVIDTNIRLERSLARSERDVAERKQAEEALQKAHDELELKVKERTRELSESMKEAEAANRAKSDLMANMSHELRTPLTAINGFSSLMTSETFGPLNEKYMEYAADINSSGQHLLKLIGDILDVSAIEAGKLELREETLDVGKVVAATMLMVRGRATEGNVHVTGNADDGLPMLHADKRRLMQILLNLLSNAVKFTPSGGEVSLSASLDGGDAHVFTVTDTGVGMDEEGLVDAMTQFGQVDSGLDRKQEGTGLGLPLTRELVELHGGTFEIESEKGKGTTVTVRFPPQRTVDS